MPSIKSGLQKLLKDKLLILLIASIIIVLMLPAIFMFPSNAGSAEAALATSEEFRNSALWLFDNTLVPVLMLAALLMLFDLILRRRITVLKKRAKTLTAIIILLMATPALLVNSMDMSSRGDPARQQPLANKVIIVTFDGARADVFWSMDHWITQHRDEGAWAKKFVATYPTVTYPNHISIVTGTWPQIHGCELGPGYFKERRHLILRNFMEPTAEDIFEIADDYGIITATFFAPRTLSSFIGDSNTTRLGGGEALPNIDQALEFITEHEEEIEENGLLMFIHLVDSDEAIHEFSTDSREYRSAITMEGNLIGRLISNIMAKGWANDTVIIVTADHGGIGYGHFNRFPTLVDEVPFWVWGGPIQPGAVISGGRLIDIAPTVAFILGIRKPKECVGVVLYRIFRQDVLENLRGISDVESLILREYSASLRRAYLDVVIYLLGFVIVIFILLLVARDLIVRGRIIRRLA